MKILDAYKSAFAQLPPEIRCAELEAEREAAMTVTVSDGARQGCSASDVTELFVRAGGDRTGFAYTQDLEEEPLAVIRRAYENSLWSQAAGPEHMNEPRTAAQGREQTPAAADIQALWEKAETIGRWLADSVPALDSYTVSVTDRVRTVGLVNTNGCDVCRAERNVFVELLAVKHGAGGFSREYTFPALDEGSPARFAGDLRKWQACMLPETELAPGSYPCVLDSAVMANILLTSWQMFSGRNYLDRRTPYAGLLGRSAASPILCIADLASMPDSGFRCAADAEGTACRDVEIVRGGVLCGLMHDLTSAAAMGAEPTGSAGRRTLLSGNIHTDMLVMPRNFGILPGEGGVWPLLARLGDGLYIFESFDEFHSVNIGSGDFSIPCSGAVVKGGKLIGRVEGLTMSGTVQGLLSSVTAVGADLAVLPMVMLRSYAVFSPSVLVTGVSVSK